jgi:hypothetical protein
MSETSLKLIVVDGLEAYLGSGKSAAEIAYDLRGARVGDGFSESDLRLRVRALVGGTESSVAAFLDNLIGAVGTNGTLTKAAGLYSVA